MSGPSEAAPEIWRETYAQCFQEKRHYDLLSWSIGAGTLVFAGFVTTIVLNIPAEQRMMRLLTGFVIIPLVMIWLTIYERNRIWGEICNEAARDIERRFGVDGIELRYMRAVLTKEVDRSNKDISAEAQAMPANLVPGTASPFRVRTLPMHAALYVLGALVALWPLLLALLPLTMAG